MADACELPKLEVSKVSNNLQTLPPETQNTIKKIMKRKIKI